MVKLKHKANRVRKPAKLILMAKKFQFQLESVNAEMTQRNAIRSPRRTARRKRERGRRVRNETETHLRSRSMSLTSSSKKANLRTKMQEISRKTYLSDYRLIETMNCDFEDDTMTSTC